MEIRWDTLARSEWNRSVDAQGAALQQHWSYGATCTLWGRTILRAEIIDQGQRIGLAQILCRRAGRLGTLSLVSRGPVWLSSIPIGTRIEALKALRQHLPSDGPHIQIVTGADPSLDRDCVEAGMIRVARPDPTAVLDLDHPAETLRSGLSGKWRNRLVRAEGCGLTIDRCDADVTQFQWLLQAEARQQRNKGYRGLPPRFVEAWHALDAQAVRVFSASNGGAPIAAMAFLCHGTSATYQIGWCGDTGRALNAHNLLMWHAMDHFRKRGIRRLDLGTLSNRSSPGLARFKAGTGAQVVEFGATYVNSRLSPVIAGMRRRRARPPLARPKPL